MMTGQVSDDGEGLIALVVRGPKGERRIAAAVDTGFNGFLSLPGDLIGLLGMPWLTAETAILADGSQKSFDVYEGTVLWDGKPVRVFVDAAETDPLVGMALMQGYELCVQVRPGGEVRLQGLDQ